MAARHTAVFGIYSDQNSTEAAVEAFKNAGFRNTDISVLFSESQGSKDLAPEKHTKAPEGATTGIVSGSFLGGALGWLAGLGALAIPGVGPFIAAGPLIGLLGGMGIGGTVGALAGSLIGLGIPEYEAKRYEGRIQSGGLLLSVHADNAEWVNRGRMLLEQTGAQDISTAVESPAESELASREENDKEASNVR